MMKLDPEAVEAAAKHLYNNDPEGMNALGFGDPWETFAPTSDITAPYYRHIAATAITAYIAAIEPEFNKRLIAMLRDFQASSMAFATAHKASVIEEKQALYDSSKADLYALFGLEAE